MFCRISDRLGNPDRVSGAGTISSASVLLGTKTPDPDKLVLGMSGSSLQSFAAFFDGAGVSLSPFKSCLEKTVQGLDSSFWILARIFVA